MSTTNTWPDGVRRAMHQDEHESWNSANYPGTRQLCSQCDEPTGRCEDDSIYADDDREIGPLCVDCWHKTDEYILSNSPITNPEEPKEKYDNN